MSTNYPTAVDDSITLPNPSATSPTNNPSLAGAQSNQNDAIKATETKLGTGSSTPASNTLLVGTGAGVSAWQGLTSAQLAAILSDETGSGANVFANTPTLITPKVDIINENTVGNGVTIAGMNIKSGAITTANSVTTANIAANAVTGAKIASYSTNRQNNTGTNITESTAKIQTGWVAFQPGTGSSGQTTITFPQAFTSLPIVTATFAGDTAGVTSTLGQGLNVKQAYADVLAVTTTTFVFLIATRDSTNYAAGNTVYGTWIAIGA